MCKEPTNWGTYLYRGPMIWRFIHCRSLNKSWIKYNRGQCHINTVNFLKKFSQQTPHIWPIRVRYGVSFVSTKTDSCSASFIAVLCAILCYIRLCYNGTGLKSCLTTAQSLITQVCTQHGNSIFWTLTRNLTPIISPSWVSYGVS